MNFGRECSRTFKEQRHEESERLPEHVTEGKEIKNSDGLKWSRPLLVFVDLLLKRPQVGADISVPMNDAFRFSCGAGRVDNFDDVVWTYFTRSKGMAGAPTADGIEHCIIDYRLRFRFRTNSLYQLL